MTGRVHVIRMGPPSSELPAIADDVYECNAAVPYDSDECPEPVIVHSETRYDARRRAWVCIHCGERTAMGLDA